MPVLNHLELTDPEFRFEGVRFSLKTLRHLKLTFSKYGHHGNRGQLLLNALGYIDAPLLEIVKITGITGGGDWPNQTPTPNHRGPFLAVWCIVLDDCFNQLDAPFLRSMANIFPNISKLACIANPYPSMAFDIDPLVAMLEASGTKVWLELRTVAFDAFVMKEGRLSVELVKKLCFARRDIGLPIQELQVPEERLSRLRCLSSRSTSAPLSVLVYIDDGFPTPLAEEGPIS
ncbi:hypothetical protein HWV62_33793 [Athelia sp. TMB]|nr:hypothetical protein HWV62_33793 [Athelia sp. TMB]